MPRTYVFADESGNFDFSTRLGATKYFILTTLTAPDCSLGDGLLVCCPVNCFRKSVKFRDDRVGGGRPREGARRTIVPRHQGLHPLHELADGAEGAAPDGALGDEAKPALDLVEPGGV